jgi:hypothetical protein
MASNLSSSEIGQEECENGRMDSCIGFGKVV